jgi:hypothetical protein
MSRGWHLAFTFPEDSSGFWSFVGNSAIGGPTSNLQPLRKVLRAIRDSNFACHDCKENLSDLFALKDDLWNQISPFPNGRGLLCLPCTQKRVGRPLSPGDFKLVPANQALLLMWDLGVQSQHNGC